LELHIAAKNANRYDVNALLSLSAVPFGKDFNDLAALRLVIVGEFDSIQTVLVIAGIYPY
jgi:hypothetical protein